MTPMSQTEPNVLVTREGGVAIVTLNRPGRRNGVTEQLCIDLHRALADIALSDARVVVLRDVLGREVWRQEIAEGGVQTLVVSTQSLPVGVYIVDTEVARTLLRVVR